MLGLVWLRTSLARKISLLFGAAVLLTIAVTLVFPWLQMSALNQQAMLLQAKEVATAVRQAVDTDQPDWQRAQAQLRQVWRVLASELGLAASEPQLVADGPGAGPGFQSEALAQLRQNKQQRYYWKVQRDGRLFRFAMAIRGTEADRHPDALRGMVDVRLPIPQAAGVWNAVVTVLAGASGAVLAILVFYLVTQRLVLSPVHSLRRVAEKVTTGDTDVRASIESGDEFEQLADAFNDMLAHLKEAQDEQEKINRSLDVRVGELAETNTALYESVRVKNEFLANVTHELRTPLVSIIGFAELLRDAREGPEADPVRLARFSENILTSGRSLLAIINDLLDLTKIEAGKLQLHVSEFSIAALCEDMIDFVRPLADKREQHLTLRIGEALPPGQSDTGKIKQVLYNLLSNAVKFTPTGGTIRLDVARNGSDFFRLAVEDTGPGIPEDKHERVFEKFHQLDGSQTREHEGTGLGLAITKELVSMLGGTIRIESHEQTGSTFIVQLPARLDPSTRRSRAPVT